VTVDAIVVFVFGVLTYLGWRTGALGQALRIVAAIAVILLGPIAAELAREAMFGQSRLAEPIIEVASYFVGITLLYVSVVAAGWIAIRAMRATSDGLTRLDRTAGAGVGAVKASLLVYILMSGVLLLWSPLQNIDPDDDLHLRDGYSTAMAAEYDLLSPWRLPELDALHRMLRVGASVREGDKAAVLRERDQAAADLLRREAVAELLQDEQLMEAVRADRYPETLADARIRALLNDDPFVEKVGQVDWARLEREFGDPGAESPPDEELQEAGEAQPDPTETSQARRDSDEPVHDASN
jgi:uncharacterized membrane protein required for colicin V production